MEEPAGRPPSPPEPPPYLPPSPPDPPPYGLAPPGASSAAPLLPPSVSWAPAPPPPRSELRPVVSPPGHPLYVAYAIVMMLLYAASAVYGYLLMEDRVSPGEEYDPELLRLWGVVMLSFGAFMALVYLVGIVAPKQPWAWVYKLVLICIGLTSCLLWPVTIPLLKRWFKPDMKRYYRMR